MTDFINEKHLLLKEQFENEKLNKISLSIENDLKNLRQYDSLLNNNDEYKRSSDMDVMNNYSKDILNVFNTFCNVDYKDGNIGLIFNYIEEISESIYFLCKEVKLPNFSFKEIMDRFIKRINEEIFSYSMLKNKDNMKLEIRNSYLKLLELKDYVYFDFEEDFKYSNYELSHERFKYVLQELDKIINYIIENYPEIKDENMDDSYYDDLFKNSIDQLIELESYEISEAKEIRHGIKKIGKKIVNADRKISNAIDDTIDGTAQEIRRSEINNIRDSILKGRTRVSTLIKRAIAIGTTYAINPVLGILTTIITLARKKKLTKKQKNIMLNDLKLELEILEEKIKDADSDNDRKKKYQYMRLRNQIKKSIAVLRSGGSLKDIDTNLIKLDH